MKLVECLGCGKMLNPKKAKFKEENFDDYTGGYYLCDQCFKEESLLEQKEMSDV